MHVCQTAWHAYEYAYTLVITHGMAVCSSMCMFMTKGYAYSDSYHAKHACSALLQHNYFLLCIATTANALAVE